MVGRSFIPLARRAVVTPMARRRPPCTCGVAVEMVANIMCVSPETTEATPGPSPLYGTCVIVTPAIRLNSSPARWLETPWPPDANDSLFGLAFAYVTSSSTEETGSDGLMTRTSGMVAVSTMGAKAVVATNGMTGIVVALITTLLTDPTSSV